MHFTHFDEVAISSISVTNSLSSLKSLRLVSDSSKTQTAQRHRQLKDTDSSKTHFVYFNSSSYTCNYITHIMLSTYYLNEKFIVNATIMYYNKVYMSVRSAVLTFDFDSQRL